MKWHKATFTTLTRARRNSLKNAAIADHFRQNHKKASRQVKGTIVSTQRNVWFHVHMPPLCFMGPPNSFHPVVFVSTNVYCEGYARNLPQNPIKITANAVVSLTIALPSVTASSSKLLVRRRMLRFIRSCPAKHDCVIFEP